MNRARNLPIEDIIKALEYLKSLGYTNVDAIIFTEYDLAFRPTESVPEKPEEPAKTGDLPEARLGETNILDIT